MPRIIQDSKLSSRSARARLACDVRQEHRCSLSEGLSLIYRKGKRAGKWSARIYDPRTQRYHAEYIGVADDTSDADGIQVFSWSQAQERARDIATEAAAKVQGKRVGPYTVADAMEDYHRGLEHQGRSAHDSRRRTELYILPSLGSIQLKDLDVETLRQWLADMANHPGYRRGGQAPARKNPRSEEQAADFERKRRDSANRILTILKAGLNYAFNEGKVSSDAAWSAKRLKPFRGTSKARPDYLSKAEVKRLVNAASPGFRDLIRGALYTGARYGDLIAMDVADFKPDAGVIISANAKTSSPTPTYLTDEGVDFFGRLTLGRPPSEPMFVHPSGGRWGKSQQSRPMSQAVARADIEVPITFHGLRHTYASHAVMNGVPLLVIAQNLGHKDTRMVEKHYGHLANSYMRETLRNSGPRWELGDQSNVVRLR